MVCLYCSQELSVSNSRPQKSRNQVWRRRPCKACGAVFTSIESIDLSKALIVTKPAADGEAPTLSAFERDKLFISLYESLRHRPAAASDARGLCDTVIAHIIKNAEHGAISPRTIFSLTLNTLSRFDAAAATHYVAFHPHDMQSASISQK
jgi:transcriptional regulator NrdR family protein